MSRALACPRCHGTGITPADLVPGTTCPRCNGAGKLPPYMASPDAWEIEARRNLAAHNPELVDWLIADVRRHWRRFTA